MVGEMKEKGDNKAYIWTFICFPSTLNGELLYICVLERIFSDQAIQFAISTAYIGSIKSFFLCLRYSLH